jgi:hypothetical protein
MIFYCEHKKEKKPMGCHEGLNNFFTDTYQKNYNENGSFTLLYVPVMVL